MCYEGGEWRMMTQDIKPFGYICLILPHSLQVIHIETHRWNITWTISQVSHYIQNDVEFKVRLRCADHSWEGALLLTLRQNQQWISLENLAPDMKYELQVQAKPQLGSSEVWRLLSQPLAFRTVPSVALRHVGSYRTRDWTRVSCICRWILHFWATREAPSYGIYVAIAFTVSAHPLLLFPPSLLPADWKLYIAIVQEARRELLHSRYSIKICWLNEKKNNFGYSQLFKENKSRYVFFAFILIKCS